MAKILIGNIKGEKGEKGDKGDTGASFKISEIFDTYEELKAVENPSAGDAYGVGSNKDYDIYVYSPTKGWVNNGAISLDINEQTPNFKEATGIEIDNINIESATTISVIFGKIKRAISELISHLKNKSNPHNVTTEQIGAIPKEKNIVVGTKNNQDTTYGGVRVGIVYTEDDIPMVGMGTELGTNALILTSGCDYTNSAKKTELGKTGYIFPVELEENRTSFPVALKISNSDGKVYVVKSSDGKKHYSKDEVLNMSEHEVLHSGNIANHNVLRFETKTYTGNGLYGVDNARTFTFSFLPRMFFISGYGPGGGNYTLTVPQGFPFVSTVAADSGGGFTTLSCNFKYSGNSITIYNPLSATNGFNIDGSPYLITAIG